MGTSVEREWLESTCRCKRNDYSRLKRTVTGQLGQAGAHVAPIAELIELPFPGVWVAPNQRGCGVDVMLFFDARSTELEARAGFVSSHFDPGKRGLLH